MQPEDKEKLEEFLEEMRDYKARHTELITVYVPAGLDINIITKQLESEKSTASNIKSTSTRKNVESALDSLIRVTKSLQKTPPHGLSLFAGNVSETEGQDKFIVKSFEPPEELTMRLYRCDQDFVLDPLEDMLEIKEFYGLVVLDRREATIGLLAGKKIKILQGFDSMVPGKTNKGGQCLSPDTQVTVNGKSDKLFNINVDDIILGYDFGNGGANETLCTNKWNVKKNKIVKIFFNKKSIISSEDHLFFIHSNGDIIKKSAVELNEKDNLLDEKGKPVNIDKIEYRDGETRLIDIETKNHNFIANGLIVHNSSARYGRIRDNMAKEFYKKVAVEMKKQFFNMENLKGILVGGPGPTKEDFLKQGDLVTALKNKVLTVKDIGYADEHGIELLVDDSKDVLEKQEIYKEKKLLEKFFNMLGKEKEKTAYSKEDIEKALKFGAVELLLLSKKLEKGERKKLEKKAEGISSNVEIVSVDTEEGQQFWNLGGVGAILRFKVQ